MYQHHRRENCYVSFTSSGTENRWIDSTVSRYRNIVEQMKLARTESGIPVLTTSIDFLFQSSQPDPGASLSSILFFHSFCSSVVSIVFFFIYYYIRCFFCRCQYFSELRGYFINSFYLSVYISI